MPIVNVTAALVPEIAEITAYKNPQLEGSTKPATSLFVPDNVIVDSNMPLVVRLVFVPYKLMVADTDPVPVINDSTVLIPTGIGKVSDCLVVVIASNSVITTLSVKLLFIVAIILSLF
jgi:hypothetical protein